MEPVQLVAGLAAAAVMLLWALPSVARVRAQMAAMVRPIV
jgi:hypothetical protein